MLLFRFYYFDNISLDEKSYKNILIYNISYKTLIGAYYYIYIFIIYYYIHWLGDYNKAKYLILSGLENYNAIYDSIKFVIGLKAVLNMLFLIIMQKSKLIHIIISLYNKHWLCIIL